jgi:hypothetical protein
MQLSASALLATSVSSKVYVPGGQIVQSVSDEDPAGICELLPGPHETQALLLVWAALVEYLPTTHAMHTNLSAFVGETASLYLPAKQLMHAVSDAELYWPVEHSLQTVSMSAPVSVELLPELHVAQVWSAFCPFLVEYLPFAQSMQSVTASFDGDVTRIYFPAAH